MDSFSIRYWYPLISQWIINCTALHDTMCGCCLLFFAAQEPSPPQSWSWRVSEKAGYQVSFCRIFVETKIVSQQLQMNICREFRDYVQFLKGNYVPTEAKLRSMVESGFVFPETCKGILKPMEVMEMLMSSPAGHHNPSL